ncbi:MFS transporter [Candidatus Woesearchaeota archaeon]|nr:MFS transporter [Candidatus Woesearchaeota archaeon]
MGILVKKQRGTLIVTGIAKLSIIAFIVALAFASINTIWALYIDSFVHNESLVGLVSSLLAVISFLSYLILVPIIEKSEKPRLFLFSLLLFSISYLFFSINKNFIIFLLLASIITILDTIRITSFGIIVRDKSTRKNLPRNEGLKYTFLNIAWVIGPLMAGYIAEKSGIPIVFILASLLIFLAFVLFKISKIKNNNIKKKPDINLIKNFLEFFKDKNRVLAYFISGGLSFWWGSLIYLFMPLYIIRSNLDNLWVGYFLFAIALPLIFLEFKFSKLALKIGFKKMFMLGFFIAFSASLICFFLSNIYLIMLILVLASFGLAMIEPNSESFFFESLKTKEEELKYYSPYNTSIEVFHFIGRILSSLVIFLFAFKSIFLLFAILMLIMFFIVSKIKDISKA